MTSCVNHLDQDLRAYSGNYPSLADYVDDAGTNAPARLCIMTQDIFGPVKNAGIGTAFMYAAEYLAKTGHDVTILFTQGRISHTRPIDYWIDFYKERGIKFICADSMTVVAPCPALQWSYMGFRSLLRMDPFDIVHSSECGASPYYSLIAKRNLGLFEKTIFCTKNSSPHLWNRQGNDNTINMETGLIICAAERYCVEKADLVISPTKHMLDWMVGNGYKLPKNVCVQPNPVPLPQLGSVSDEQASSVHKVDEFVFFGRLEARKGILIFAEALDLLFNSGVKDCKVTFLGKKTDDFNFDELLSGLRLRLPYQFSGIHTYDAKQAISYVQQKGRMAMVPSLIDQAALTAYESIMSGVPFIAANVGGIPEIVHPADRSRVMVLPRPQALFKAMERCLNRGAYTARLSFRPEMNFQVWDSFHRNPDKTLLGRSSADAPNASDHSPLDLVFDETLADPVNIDDSLSILRAAEARFVTLRLTSCSLTTEVASTLAAQAEASNFGIIIPSFLTKTPKGGHLVHFEPSLWTKLEFSKLTMPGYVIEKTLLISILEYLGQQPLIYQCSLDTIVAVALRLDGRVSLAPNVEGYFSGVVNRNLTRRQRARQVEQLVRGLEPDLANVYRLYGGLIDERNRVIATQAVLRNLQRLLRVLGKLEVQAGSPRPLVKRRGKPAFKGWIGWRRPLPKSERGLMTLTTWLRKLARRRGASGRLAKPED